MAFSSSNQRKAYFAKYSVKKKGVSYKARKFISRKVRINIREGYPQNQAVAISYFQARKRGYRV